jgi:hypothetical protein
MDMTDTELKLDDIRSRLDRPDLSDAELVVCLEEAAVRLGLTARAEDLLARPATDTDLCLAVSCMALPQPRYPMTMPEHDLVPEKSSRAAFSFWKKRPALLPLFLRKR